MKHGSLPFYSENVNIIFNAFLDTYLDLLLQLPIKKIQTATKRNDWVTTSCKYKQELYITCRNNPELRNYYKKYCKVLSTVIKETEGLKYDSKIKKSNNQNKTVGDTVKMETGKINTHTQNYNIGRLKFEDKLTNDHKNIVYAFNQHFISVAENITKKKNHNDCSIKNMENTTPIHHLLQCFKCTFPNFKLKLSSSWEVKNIIKSLKTKNSHGYDKISTKLQKISSPFIMCLLTHIHGASGK